MCSATSLLSVLRADRWNLKDIEELLEKDSSSINQEKFHRFTLLQFVLRQKNCSVDVVKLLMKYGADVNCYNIGDIVPLHVALYCSRDDAVVMALIENGADVHVSGLLRESSLCLALNYYASTNVIEFLLHKGCSLNSCDHAAHGGSVLHCAADCLRSGLKSDVLKMLNGRGADINAVDKKGRSVVCFALQDGYEAHSLKLLMKAGGSLNGCPIHASPFFCAEDTPLKASVIKLLLGEGACVDTVNAEGQTPLQCALRKCGCKKEAITLLLDCHKGVDLNFLVDKGNNSLLHLAVGNIYCIPSVVKLLIKRGVEVDKVNLEGKTALNVALSERHCKLSIVKILLKNGAKPNTESVVLAVEKFHEIKIFKMLLAAGASVDELTFISMLKMLFDQCTVDFDRLVCFKFLIRYYFLKVSDYHMPFLDCHPIDYNYLLSFRDQCVDELRKLKTKNVGQGQKLHEFLIGCSSPYKDAANRETKKKMYDLNRLLDVIANDAFPLFIDIISDKIGRPLMETKLQEIHVYAVKYSPDNTRVVEKFFLYYKCVLEIARHLKDDEDLLRFILAFYNADGRVFNAQEGKDRKRTAEELNLCCKHPKICKK